MSSVDTTAIIGDIHGCLDTFLKLLSKLPDSIEQIYSVGDLIDRGPKSKEVVQECIDRKIKCVKGNHEDMFLSYIHEDYRYDKGIFDMNGGLDTLRSYKSGESGIEVPDEHLEFFLNMPTLIETDDFLLTHAGIPVWMKDEFRSTREDIKDGLMWDRGRKSRELGKLQIHGHTPNEYPRAKLENGKIVAINVDTGCAFERRLTAVLLPSVTFIQVLNTHDRKVVVPSIY